MELGTHRLLLGAPKGLAAGATTGLAGMLAGSFPASAQGRVEGQGVPPGPACLTHPRVLTPGWRGGHQDTVSLQLVCAVLGSGQLTMHQVHL